MDLSKPFDTLNIRLLLAKLKGYCLQPTALKQMKLSYLTCRHQRTKVINAYSSWSEIIAGIPQGPTEGRRLFKNFLNDLFLYSEETFLSNYTDNTFYLINNTMDKVKNIQHQF